MTLNLGRATIGDMNAKTFRSEIFGLRQGDVYHAALATQTGGFTDHGTAYFLHYVAGPMTLCGLPREGMVMDQRHGRIEEISDGTIQVSQWGWASDHRCPACCDKADALPQSEFVLTETSLPAVGDE